MAHAHGGHGGRRPGAGRPLGSKAAHTLSKEAARDALRVLVLAQLGPMVKAQIARARGLKYLVAREKKTGKFTRVGKDAAELLVKVKGGKDAHEVIEVWEDDPSTAAFTDLMNRALDKPAEQPLDVQISGSVDLIARLAAARERLAARKREAKR